MRVRAFARMRELLGGDVVEVELRGGSRVADLADALRTRFAQTAELLAVTKFARNGRVVGSDDALSDGDEVALLPPVSGG